MQLICKNEQIEIMARYSEVKKILKSHNLRITDGRVDMLEFFLEHKRALTIKDIQDEFKDSDRVTIYRTINSFTDHGVIHKIPDESGIPSYGLCHETCDAEDHHHDHMHFKCNECGIIECLDQDIPHIDIPGYKVSEANMILKGTCKTCTV